MPTLAHITRTTAGAALLTGALLTGLSAPAYAHDTLISTNPEAGSTLTEAPRQLELTYSGEIMQVDGANQVNVVDADGNSVTDGSPDTNGKTVTQDLTTAGAEDDTYTVTWRVVSSDGHPIQGTFTYDVGAGKEVASAQPGSDTSATATPAGDPLTAATSGLSTGAKIGIAVLAALAIIGGAIVVLTKNKKK